MKFTRLRTSCDLSPDTSHPLRLTSETLLFSTRVSALHTTNNVRRQLRNVMGQVGIDNVTLHRFRRTVATAINEIGGLQLASEFLGHSDPAITREHYIRRNETVIPLLADYFE